jgi:hypothetical protein
MYLSFQPTLKQEHYFTCRVLAFDVPMSILSRCYRVDLVNMRSQPVRFNPFTKLVQIRGARLDLNKPAALIKANTGEKFTTQSSHLGDSTHKNPVSPQLPGKIPLRKPAKNIEYALKNRGNL